MNKPNNVIDLKTRRRQTRRISNEGANAAPVLDMTERRQEILSDERREVKRTILSEFIGAFVVLPDQGLQRVAIHDISENGIAFDLDLGIGKFRMGEEVAMRVYMNNQTYFPFIVKVANARDVMDEAVTRHGGEFVKGTVNDEALFHFVKFIETVSASLQTDRGDVMVSNLSR